jgi:uncharacterized protein YecT (DUF1311 family)
MVTKLILAAFGVAMGFASWATAAPLAVERREIKDAKAAYTMAIAFPKTGHRAIDPMLEAWARDAERDFLDIAKEAGGPPGPWSLDVTYEVARNDAAMFAVVFTHGSYTGGAHPNSHTRTFNFLMPDGVEVELPELFTPRGMAQISDDAVAQLSKRLLAQEMSDADWIKRGAGPNGRNFRSFVLKADVLTLYFDAYQMAPYVAGPQEATMARAKLKGSERADPRAPAPAFDCARAKSQVEKAICASRELARLDRHVSEAYAANLSGAADEAKRAAIRKEQRAWIKDRDAACLSAALPLETCLIGMYRVRLRVLEGGD